MSPVRLVERLLRPVCRLVERMVDGYAQERAEAKLRHASVRVDGIDRARDGASLKMSADDNTLADEAEAYLRAERDARLLDRLAEEMPPAAHQRARWVALNVDRRWAR